jgi:hypothetical protein
VEVQERRAGSSNHGRALCRRLRSDRGYAFLFPSLPILLREIEHPNTQFHLFAAVIGCTCVHPCPMLGPPLHAGEFCSTICPVKPDDHLS